MDTFNVNRDAVDTLIRRYVEATGNGQFSISEVILANSEFLGRMIVNLTETPISGMHMAQATNDHLMRTLEAGFSAKGFNLSGRV